MKRSIDVPSAGPKPGPGLRADARQQDPPMRSRLNDEGGAPPSWIFMCANELALARGDQMPVVRLRPQFLFTSNNNSSSDGPRVSRRPLRRVHRRIYKRNLPPPWSRKSARDKKVPEK
jgi:hypothetical protein